MEVDEPPVPKEAARSDDGKKGDGNHNARITIDISHDDAPNREAGPSNDTDAALLATARLRNLIQHRPRATCSDPVSTLAWSSTNTIAVARSSRITLTHLLAPSRVCHLATRGKIHQLTFSPRGDALLATFSHGGRACLWMCEGGTLNQWRLRGEWTHLDGTVLDLRWLGASRRRQARDLKRSRARGPQLVREMDGVGVLLLTDAGQLTLIHGSVAVQGELRSSQHRIALAPQQRLQQASIGLVPNEPLAIIAYTVRLSSKVQLSQTSGGVSDALGMFLDDADGAGVEGDAPPNDGQDKIEMYEVRVDMDTISINSTLRSRPLMPIFVASYEDQLMPLASSAFQLLWIEAERQDTEGPSLRLFAGFFECHCTILRTWVIKREEVDRLSDAFSRLESAKGGQEVEIEEDWIAQDPRESKFDGLQMDEFVANNQAAPRLLCSLRRSGPVTSLSDVPRPSRRNTLFDLDAMAEVQSDHDPVNSMLAASVCRLALSPHGTMAVGLVRGKLSVAAVIGIEPDVARSRLLAAALLQYDDLSDLLLSNAWDIKDVAVALSLNAARLSPLHALHLASLQARRRSLNDSARQSCCILLDLFKSSQLLASARQGADFDLSKIWLLAARVEWMTSLLNMTARQAYLLCVKSDTLSPPPAKSSESGADEATKTEGTSDRGDGLMIGHTGKCEPDMLSLLAHSAPRMLASKCIARLVNFCNWLDGLVSGRSGTSKEAFKTLVARAAASPQAQSNSIGRGAERLRDTLLLCHLRVQELVLQSSIDLAKAGRSLMSCKTTGTEDEEGEWYLAPTASMERRELFARSLLAGGSVQNVLDLLCPHAELTSPGLGNSRVAEAKEDESTTDDGAELQVWGPRLESRDALTRAAISLHTRSASTRRVCLTCNGQTLVENTLDDRCHCGAKTWWATRR